MGVCNCSMFCCTLLYVHFSIAIILMGKRELIALLNLSSWCLVMVERLFLTVPQGCLQFVIVVFPDHTHLLFLDLMVILGLLRLAGAKSLGCFTGGVLGRGLTGVGRRGVLFKRSSHWFGICFSLYSLSIRAASSQWVPVCRCIGIRSLGFTFGHSRWDCHLTRVLLQVGHMKQNPECCSSKCFFTFQHLSNSFLFGHNRHTNRESCNTDE